MNPTIEEKVAAVKQVLQDQPGDVVIYVTSRAQDEMLESVERTMADQAAMNGASGHTQAVLGQVRLIRYICKGFIRMLDVKRANMK